MGEDSERSGKGFVVIDRRAAARDDETAAAQAAEVDAAAAAKAAKVDAAAAAGEGTPTPPPPPSGSASEPSAAASREAGEAERKQALPPIDFSTLVHSFAATAFYHLGAAPGPDGKGQSAVNLPLAKENVDILQMLREKTQGNLDPEESRFLDSVLYEAQMRFVEVSKASG